MSRVTNHELRRKWKQVLKRKSPARLTELMDFNRDAEKFKTNDPNWEDKITWV